MYKKHILQYAKNPTAFCLETSTNSRHGCQVARGSNSLTIVTIDSMRVSEFEPISKLEHCSVFLGTA